MTSDPDRLLILQRQLTVVILTAAMVAALFFVGSFFADILRILSLSFLLSYLLINIVDLLEKPLKHRAIAIGVVYVIMVAITVVAAFFLIPAVVYQVNQLVTSTIDKTPEFLQYMAKALEPLEARFRAYQIELKAMDVITSVVSNLPKPDPTMVINRVTDMAMSTMTWVLYAISIAVVSFYFLLDGHNFKNAIIKLFPQRHFLALDKMTSDMDYYLQAFFKGQLVMALAFGVVMFVVYSLLGVEYALLCSLGLALCEILPVIGPPIGFVPAVVAVAIHGTYLPGNHFVQIVILTVIFAVLQQIKDNIVAPRYIGNVLGLHPVMVFIAIMVGARIDGILGIIVALPAASIINVALSHLPLQEPVLEPVAPPEAEA